MLFCRPDIRPAGRAHEQHLCCLGEPNLHISIVKDRVIGFHEYITQDPATPISHCQNRGQQVHGAFAFSFEDANILLFFLFFLTPNNS
jgi:hypothetical protein